MKRNEYVWIDTNGTAWDAEPHDSYQETCGPFVRYRLDPEPIPAPTKAYALVQFSGDSMALFDTYLGWISVDPEEGEVHYMGWDEIAARGPMVVFDGIDS